MNSDKLANIMPQGYEGWRKEMEKLIERSKLTAVMNVNAEMLSLYWKIGHDIMGNRTRKVGVRKSSGDWQTICAEDFRMTEVSRLRTSN